MVLKIYRRIILCIVVLCTLVTVFNPAISVYAKSQEETLNNNNMEILSNQFNLTNEEKIEVAIISKYMSFDKERFIPVFDVEKAEKDNIPSKLIEEGKIFNQNIIDNELENSDDNEISTYAGKTYVTKKGTNWYQVGLSGSWCKKIVGWIGNGATWLVSTLVTAIPIIGPVAGPLVAGIMNIGTTALKQYVNTGITIELRKYINASGWSVTYWRQ